MQGKTEQESTTGKNLFDANGIDSTRHILGDLSGFSDVDVGSYNLSNIIPVKEGESIVKSGTTGSPVVGFLGADKSFLKGISLTDGKPVTVPAGAFYFCCNIAVANIKNKIQIEKSNTVTEYEQYTGGKPSPSVEYPQEIVNAGDNGQIEVQVTGKNLFDTNLEKKGFITSSGYIEKYNIQNNEKYGEYIKINQYESICATVNATIPSTEGAVPWIGLAFYDKDKNFIVRKDLYEKVLRVTIPKNAFYMIGTYRKYKDGVLQIEYGNVATAYESHKEPQEVQLQLDSPLTKWDRIEKRDGVWGIVRQSRIKNLLDKDVIEEYIPVDKMFEEGLHCYKVLVSDGILKYKSSYCTHFKNVNFVYDPTVAKNGIYSDHNSSMYKYFISDKQTIEEFKAWILQQKETGTPVELVYETIEEVWEPLPEETQIALNALRTNYPTTIITNSEDCEMEVEYIADTKNYTDKRFAELSASIVATQKALL